MGRRARVNGSSSPSARGLERFEFWARGSLRACELWRFGACLGRPVESPRSRPASCRQEAAAWLLGNDGLSGQNPKRNEKQLSTKEEKWR